MIYLISKKNTALINRALQNSGDLNKKDADAEVLPGLSAKKTLNGDDQVYVDAAGFTSAEFKKLQKQIKESGAFLGIIDPKGEISDPALYIFEGAGDYMGQALFKKGLSKKRFELARSFTLAASAGNSQKQQNGSKKKKLPSGKFEGWKSIRSGATAPFFFLFVTFFEYSNIRTMIGESAYITLRNRFRAVLQKRLKEANALLWMETENNILFLLPPKAPECKKAIEAVLKILMNSRLINIESLYTSTPVEFIFALHYGDTIFKAPGKTGEIISESVNYIFHLGAKKAEAGRLTVSNDVPGEAIPKGLEDFFINAGTFENIPILHSKRFIVCK